MRKPGPLLVAIITLPFLAGCFSVLPTPVPPPGEREGVRVRGVILGEEDGDEGQLVEWEEVFESEWRESGLFVAGSVAGGEGEVLSREFSYESITSVLTRRLDVGKTSGLIGVGIVGAVAVLSVIIGSEGGEGTTILSIR